MSDARTVILAAVDLGVRFLEKKAPEAKPVRDAAATRAATWRGSAKLTDRKPVAPARPRKLTWKEARELEEMEARISAIEAEIARVEGLFTSPDFHRENAARTPEFLAAIEAGKADLARLYTRWEELEAIRQQENARVIRQGPPEGSR
jgi:ATP-binding cassette subfamily F protein uup